MTTKLIEDLVPAIVDSTDWSNSTSSLLSFALVSPRWLWPVRRQLYAHPTLTSETQCRYLVRTLEEVPELHRLTTGLNLWLDDPPFAARGLIAVRTLLSLPKLRCVSFLSPSASALMQKIRTPCTVTHIRILPDGYPLPASVRTGFRFPCVVEWDYKQASKFISLSRLAFYGADLCIISTRPHTPYPFQHLTELTIDRCAVTHGQLSQLLDADAWARIRTLTLVLAHPWYADTSSPSSILALCANTLERLHLQCDPPRSLADIANMSHIVDDILCAFNPGLRALRALRLVGIDDVRQHDKHLNSLARIWACCPALEDLTVSGDMAKLILCYLGSIKDVGATGSLAPAPDDSWKSLGEKERRRAAVGAWKMEGEGMRWRLDGKGESDW